MKLIFPAAGLLLVCLTLAAAPATAPSSAAAPAAPPSSVPPSNDMTHSSPSPDLTPEQVVHIQLEALRRNDQPSPDAGIAVVFKFASPENQRQTGPLEKFTRMVKGPEYGLMVNHRSSQVSEVEIDPVSGEAKQLVKITAASGEVALYVFILSRQTDGAFKDCWMTDGVIRIHPQDLMPPAAPEPGGNGDGRDKV